MDTIQTLSIETLMSRALVDLNKDDRFLAHLPSDSTRIEGQGHYRLAKLYYDKADFEKAEEYFLNALKCTDLPQDAFAIFKIHGFLIRIYSESLNEKDANKYIQLSSELLDQIVSILQVCFHDY